MNITIANDRDLFEYPKQWFMSEPYWMAHCVSADYAFGHGKNGKRYGIAWEFDRRYDSKAFCIRNGSGRHPEAIEQIMAELPDGQSYGILHLVTKDKHWDKPTRNDFIETLYLARDIMLERGVQNLAIPPIGSGLDKLDWDWVSEQLRVMFDIIPGSLLVCRI